MTFEVGSESGIFKIISDNDNEGGERFLSFRKQNALIDEK